MTKIKICGITTENDITYLNEAGVDFAGFVQFYPKSKRDIPIETAVRLMKKLSPRIKRVAVVVSPGKEELEMIAQAGFDLVQIHGSIPDEFLDEIGLPVWKAFNVSDLSEFERFLNHPKVTGFVFDAQTPGSGKGFDWELLSGIPHTDKLTMLAGGIHPGNVAEAIRITKVDGVDTSSGVEDDSGNGKSREKIQAFVKAVREL